MAIYFDGIYENPLLLTDCYNTSHYFLKQDSSFELSHMYNRAKGMILYGLHEKIEKIIGTKIEKWMITEAEYHAKKMGLVFPTEMWMRVVNECDGVLPLKIQTLEEGTFVPTGSPFCQIRNTKEGFGELVTWLEPVLMMAYYSSHCATRAVEIRDYLREKKDQYGYDEGFMWRVHSFGFRGHRSLEDAYWAGTAWNLALNGTDDFHTSLYTPDAVIGSISALAHKVTQQFDEEYECFIKAIDQASIQENKIVAMVIDTYDANNVIENYIVKLAKYAKEKGVHCVFRPDSGDIKAQALRIYEIVSENNLENVSVILGEGITFEVIKEYDVWFEENNVPLSFIFYGLGSGFYNDIERDGLGWAMKTAFSNGKPRMKFSENPIKRSIPDAVDIVYSQDENNLIVYREGSAPVSGKYITIYDNGITKPYDWNKVKSLVNGVCKIDLSKRVILDEGILSLMKEFENKYL